MGSTATKPRTSTRSTTDALRGPRAKPEDYHGRKPTARELRQIFRLETERRISNDWVIRHNSRYLQLQPRQRYYGPTQSKALVCEWENGAMEVYYRRGADSIYRAEGAAAKNLSATSARREDDRGETG